jgi:hypothetical protein
MMVSKSGVVGVLRQKEEGVQGGRSEWHLEIIRNLHFSTNIFRVVDVLNQRVGAELS